MNDSGFSSGAPKSRASGGRSVRVTHLIPSDGVGGVETAARSMAVRENLACDFNLITIAGEGTAAQAKLNSPLAHLAGLVKILRTKPDVLICSLWRSALIGILAKFLLPRMRLVAFLHADKCVHLVDRVLSGALAQAADAIWADSQVTLNKRAHAKGRVISFVTKHRPPPLEPAEPPAPTFVCWNRLHPQKGLDRAIRLMAAIKQYRRDAVLEIWGPDGGAASELRHLTSSLNLSAQIKFMGPAKADQLSEIAARHTFYLQLSRYEGMAMAVVEAMQLGLVPIVTPVGEIVNYCDRANAVIVDVENLPDTVEEILSLLADPGEHKARRAKAWQHWAGASVYADDVCEEAIALFSSARDRST
jgi:glycosyltransferase involved in cell wall biosynthesis